MHLISGSQYLVYIAYQSKFLTCILASKEPTNNLERYFGVRRYLTESTVVLLPLVLWNFNLIFDKLGRSGWRVIFAGKKY